MNPILDVFAQDAFNMLSLTDAVNKLPFVPGRIAQLGIFTEVSIPTTSIALEEEYGVLTLVAPTPRGGPGEAQQKTLRTMRRLTVPHYQRDANVMADEVQNVREFGLNAGPRSLQNYLGGRMTQATMALDATLEHQRVGAIKGQVLDRDGNILYDMNTEFGTVANAVVSFNLLSPTSNLRKIIAGIIRTIIQNLGGAPTYAIRALCGDNFWDDFITHPKIEQTFLFQQGTALRDPIAYQQVNFAGISFENYRGYLVPIDGNNTNPPTVTQFLDINDCWIFPEMPELFKTYYAPADYQETVNTMGLPRYAKSIPSDNGKSTRLEVQTNALSICRRPRAIVHAIHG